VVTGRPAEPPHAPGSSGRAASAISQVYYYVAAAVGVAFLVGGAIAALIAVRQLALPGRFDTTRGSVRQLLDGLAYALPGALLFAWHIREAGRRERRGTLPGVFWGASLYYHLVALFTVFTILGGSIALLGSLVDVALPNCFSSGPILVPGGSACFPPRADAWRSVANSVIVLIVAGPVFWWHLRRGRGLAAPPPAARPDVPMMEA
jgi:hypothetical protein